MADFSSLPKFIRTRSRSIGPKPALVRVCPGGNLVWTWAQVWLHARSVALELLDEGLQEGEAVLLWADDIPEALFAEIGIQAAGAFAVRVPSRYRPGDVATTADALGARHVRVAGPSREAADALNAARPALKIRGLPPPPSPAAAPSAPGPGLDPWTEDPRLADRLSRVGPDTAALGLMAEDDPDPARGILLFQRNLVGIGTTVATALGAGEEDTWWVASPRQGAFARTAGIAAAWLSGGELVMADREGEPLETLWRTRPTVAVLGAQEAMFLADRVVTEFNRGGGPGWGLHRWVLDQARGNAPGNPVLRLLARLAGATSSSAFREVLGGRLTRVVCGGGDPGDPAVRLLGVLGAAAWTARGSDLTAGVTTFDRLPLATPRSTLVPGTVARTTAEGEVQIQGVSVASCMDRQVTILALTPDGWYPSGLPGQVEGSSVRWGPAGS